MTTLYRPIRIETAEQAEALPEGTIATHSEHWALEYFQGIWENGDTAQGHRQMIGWTALVPIEAEEEARHATDE